MADHMRVRSVITQWSLLAQTKTAQTTSLPDTTAPPLSTVHVAYTAIMYNVIQIHLLYKYLQWLVNHRSGVWRACLYIYVTVSKAVISI